MKRAAVKRHRNPPQPRTVRRRRRPWHVLQFTVAVAISFASLYWLEINNPYLAMALSLGAALIFTVFVAALRWLSAKIYIHYRAKASREDKRLLKPFVMLDGRSGQTARSQGHQDLPELPAPTSELPLVPRITKSRD
jgi:hypothetical protein